MNSDGIAFVDGEFVPVSAARIPLLDWGFLHSDATCDVVHVWKGSFFSTGRPSGSVHAQCGQIEDEPACSAPQRALPDVDADTWQQMQALRQEHPDVLNEPRIVARFLCGTTSPHLTRAKLIRHELFGRFETVPFHDVMVQAEQHN